MSKRDMGGVEIVYGTEGKAYYLSHETVELHDCGCIQFRDNSENVLAPEYFGAGLTGINATLRRKRESGS